MVEGWGGVEGWFGREGEGNIYLLLPFHLQLHLQRSSLFLAMEWSLWVGFRCTVQKLYIHFSSMI